MTSAASLLNPSVIKLSPEQAPTEFNRETSTAVTMVHPAIKAKRVYYCQRCLNHGQRKRRKNHKPTCMFGSCTCNLCILVEKRRKLNSQLQELEDDSQSYLTEDGVTALSNAVKAGGMLGIFLGHRT